LLPGVDDGCRDLDESLACIGALAEAGFVGTVCTPHSWVEQFPWNVPATIHRRVVELRESLRRAGIEWRLLSGAEVRISDRTLHDFRQFGVPTLGKGRSVLVDYWGSGWPECGREVVDYLVQHSYQPVLAHPERMDLAADQWRPFLDWIAAAGVLLQGNLKCLAGYESRRARDRSLELLDEGRYHLLATDMHGMADLDLRLDGIDVVIQRLGADAAKRLLEDHPREMLKAAEQVG
jgi:protein-tyrosine phosphatase